MALILKLYSTNVQHYVVDKLPSQIIHDKLHQTCAYDNGEIDT